MTSSYSNIQVLSRDGEAVRRAVEKRGMGTCKILGRPDSGWTAVYAFMTEGDYPHLRDCAQQLSEELNATALGLMVENGELFRYALYDCGKLLDEYCSNPGYPFEKKAATGGSATVFLKYCVQGTTKSAIRQILHPANTAGSEEFGEAERKTAGDKMALNLAPLLGIPRSQMCTGYNYLKWAGVGKKEQ